jgi:hypothetical protein
MRKIIPALLGGVLLLVALFCPEGLLAQEQRTGSLSGVLIDAVTREPLIGANIQFAGEFSRGTSTDASGRYRIDNIPSGIYTIRFSYLGYEPFFAADVVIRSNRTTQLDIGLQPSRIEGDQVTVRAGYFQSDGINPVSTVRFSPEEMRRSPGAGQELSRILSVIPGVSSAGEISQDLMVRGGSPVENGFIIDNIPMPGVAHFERQGGLSSGPIGILNTELVSGIDFYTGGFNARYGDRMSAIGDITYREGSRNGLRGDLFMSLAGFGGTAEGGLAGGNGSWLIAARRSYLDLIANAINAGGAPRYGDIQSKLVFDLSPSTKLTLLNIYGTSLFDSNREDALDDGVLMLFTADFRQITSGANLRTLWRSSGFTQTSLSYSMKRENSISTRTSDESVLADVDVVNRYINLRSVSAYRFSDALTMEFGGEYYYEFGDYDYFLDADTNRVGQVSSPIRVSTELTGGRGSVFTTLSMNPWWFLTLSAGVRADYNTYNENVDVAPRISSSLRLSRRLSLNASWGHFYQAPPRFLLSQNDDNRRLGNTRAIHSIAGLEYLLTDDTRLTLEVFQKQYDRAPQLPPLNDFGDPRYVLDRPDGLYRNLNSTGEARARGIELLIQKKLAVNFYGLVSATWFRTRYRDFSGNWQNRDFDNRVLFSIIGGYRPNNRWEFSARWSFLGGRPYTPFNLELSEQFNLGIIDMARFNSERLPDFHSLYLRMDRRYFLERRNVIFFAEIWNSYNRKNVYEYYWNQTDRRIDSLTAFTLIPVGGVKLEF